MGRKGPIFSIHRSANESRPTAPHAEDLHTLQEHYYCETSEQIAGCLKDQRRIITTLPTTARRFLTAAHKNGDKNMDLSSLSDDLISHLLTVQKRVTNPRARQVPKAKHLERNYEVASLAGNDHFVLITRQSTLIKENFSCGLIWLPAAGQKIILTRYNGYDHIHSNPIEGSSFEFSCHIHRATARYIQAGRKAEMYAETTTRYAVLADAIQCLLSDCNIEGYPGYQASDDNPQMQLL